MFHHHSTVCATVYIQIIAEKSLPVLLGTAAAKLLSFYPLCGDNSQLLPTDTLFGNAFCRPPKEKERYGAASEVHIWRMARKSSNAVQFFVR